MTSREAVTKAKKQLDAAERKLVDVRFLCSRITRALPEASDKFRPTLEDTLSRLTAATPRLESEFDQAYDVLRSLSFVARLDARARELDSDRFSRKVSSGTAIQGTSNLPARFHSQQSRGRLRSSSL